MQKKPKVMMHKMPGGMMMPDKQMKPMMGQKQKAKKKK